MKIGILFSGQGSQYPGMMKELYEAESAARKVFDQADRALDSKISGLCFEGTACEIEDICSKVTRGFVAVSNYNSPVQTVVSGFAEGVDEACELAAAVNLRCVRQAVSGPFHCALMQPAAARLEEAFRGITFRDPEIPVYMNVDGKPVTDGAAVPGLLVRQVMSPVYWQQTLENMRSDGVDVFIECGAGKTLSGLVKKSVGGVRILRVENRKTLDETLEELKRNG